MYELRSMPRLSILANKSSSKNLLRLTSSVNPYRMLFGGKGEEGEGRREKGRSGEAEKRRSGEAEKRRSGEAEKRRSGEAEKRRSGEAEKRKTGEGDKGRRSTLRLLVFTMKSLARWGVGASSRGLSTMDLSSGSPGTISQWWNTDMQKACP
jgi:hypothetical protein